MDQEPCQPLDEPGGKPMSPTALYLDLMKKILTNTVYQDPAVPMTRETAARAQVDHSADAEAFEEELRSGGEDWPVSAHTMVGRKRLDNVQACLETVLADEIPGDVIETGVWRGGVCIFMRAVLKAHDVRDRVVWVADSFEGMPVPDEDARGLDVHMRLHRFNEVLAVSLEQVKENFRRYDLLDEQVQFLPGWFRDTLPAAPLKEVAVLRLDGDLYESTMDSLENLYPKLAPGGFVIIDDYGLNTCKQAVHDYRAAHGIDEDIVVIDRWGAFWRRAS
jgi:Macrocin-O-methyltransferase (TylF)